jgi:spore coat protein A
MKKTTMPTATLGLLGLAITVTAAAVPLPGGTLNPTTIPKYVTPLVIPPVMKNNGATDHYDIAVRQFQQQILPGGIWAGLAGCAGVKNCNFPATTVWSYGPDADLTPAVAPDPNSQFNYPAYTMEARSNATITVNWINELVTNPDACKTSADPKNDKACNFRKHILPVDRSLHWANPEQLPCADSNRTKDCRPAGTDSNGNPVTILQQPYDGPVPIIVHVHGAHSTPESDGYPEAWYLPDANNIPQGYATTGTLVNQYTDHTNNAPGVATFTYKNDQPSMTAWYHDHALGMTRNNVYAGPAGFWLIRDPAAPRGMETGLVSGTLPGPAPVAGDTVVELNVPALVPGTMDKRSGIREIPLAIQDRSFNIDGSLFYPADRAFFEGITPTQLQIPLIGDATNASDIAPIWNPEAFFNTMVVNGVTWPVLEVAPALYRFRLLNGCNSRFINLALIKGSGKGMSEIPMYQIGAEQSLLPQVVRVETGFATPLPGTGLDVCPGNSTPGKKAKCILKTPASDPARALLMGLAERADVLVNFTGLADGTIVTMINTGPDAPFGGFAGNVPADPGTTGQVMRFVVRTALLGKSPTDPTPANIAATTVATAPASLKLSLPESTKGQADYDPAADGVIRASARDLALLEEESFLVCATVNPTGAIIYDPDATPDPNTPGTCVYVTGHPQEGQLAASVPFAPKAALLGNSGKTGGNPTMWADKIVTNPGLDETETWEIWNHTVDGHPIHLHLVKFKVVNREAFDPVNFGLSGAVRAPEPTEAGWKDTVIAYPGEVTRLNATFDIAGLYVWHCHIVEHEDNEMMVPYCVGDKATASGCGVVP